MKVESIGLNDAPASYDEGRDRNMRLEFFSFLHLLCGEGSTQKKQNSTETDHQSPITITM